MSELNAEAIANILIGASVVTAGVGFVMRWTIGRRIDAMGLELRRAMKLLGTHGHDPDTGEVTAPIINGTRE